MAQSRIAEGRHAHQDGLGLGLAIVSAIAAAHGAELHAVTRAAGGLAVEVVFPAAAPAPRPADRIIAEQKTDRSVVPA
jgi:K+-sensing histidine kinase KdpD